MREEGFVSGSDDVRLTVEILVPSGQVGRIIGKGGQNVRELQRVTGSIIKLPEQSASPPPQDEETTVHIIGPFFSVQVPTVFMQITFTLIYYYWMVMQPFHKRNSLLIPYHMDFCLIWNKKYFIIPVIEMSLIQIVISWTFSINIGKKMFTQLPDNLKKIQNLKTIKCEQNNFIIESIL